MKLWSERLQLQNSFNKKIGVQNKDDEGGLKTKTLQKELGESKVWETSLVPRKFC